MQQGSTTYCTVATMYYDRVKQLALNLHMQPQEFTLGELLTIMRCYSVSFERTDSSRLRDFSHMQRQGINSEATHAFTIISIIQRRIYKRIKRLSEHFNNLYVSIK